MAEGRSQSAAMVQVPSGMPGGMPPGGALHTTVSGGLSAWSPPAGRRGAPVTKRRKHRWSSASSSERMPMRFLMGVEASVYPWSILSASASSLSSQRSPHPHTSISSSGSEKLASAATGKMSEKPHRKASSWRCTPAPSVASSTSATNSPRLCTVTSREAPPSHSSKSAYPGSVKVRQRSQMRVPESVSASIALALAPASTSFSRSAHTVSI
mmetsp:Transcript_16330/g.53373  ORF Transcript_16330/g.53373 Transcript_16330/m.53373 type:complete len:212 (-) Transcript_16330:611-1246(-)